MTDEDKEFKALLETSARNSALEHLLAQLMADVYQIAENKNAVHLATAKKEQWRDAFDKHVKSSPES